MSEINILKRIKEAERSGLSDDQMFELRGIAAEAIGDAVSAGIKKIKDKAPGITADEIYNIMNDAMEFVLLHVEELEVGEAQEPKKEAVVSEGVSEGDRVVVVTKNGKEIRGSVVLIKHAKDEPTVAYIIKTDDGNTLELRDYQGKPDNYLLMKKEGKQAPVSEAQKEKRCRYCKYMQDYGAEGSMRCVKNLSKGDKTAETCPEYKPIYESVEEKVGDSEQPRDYSALAEQLYLAHYLKSKASMTEKEKEFLAKVEAIQLTEDERAKVWEYYKKLCKEGGKK